MKTVTRIAIYYYIQYAACLIVAMVNATYGNWVYFWLWLFTSLLSASTAAFFTLEIDKYKK